QKSQMLTGLLECRKKDESKLIKHLITDVRAEGVLSLASGLAARVLFLCVRQADCSGDQTRVKGLCSAAVSGFKTALKVNHLYLYPLSQCHSPRQVTHLNLNNYFISYAEMTSHRNRPLLLQDMRGSEELVPLVTDVQESVRALSDLCIQAYQQLLSISESRLQPIIVPAMLESETIPGLAGSSVKLSAGRKRAGSDPRPSASTEGATMSAVLRELSALHTALSRQDLPSALQEQAFHQLMYLLAATTLNSLLLRKDMCCWNRGLQIRYNVSLLEEWLRSRSLQTGGAVTTLEPLIQAAQLLQMSKKTEADGQAMVQACNALSNQQVVKILSLYTPQSDLEERVTLNFIRIVQGLLKGRSEGQPPQLLMDVRRVFPVTFPYLPPPQVSAAQLEIPESLKISFLRRV
uniref:Dilute domain-containing protein n=1 Tax=Sinocyclocheilus grahami TaxID=75366 RepID=A0A672P4G3_SINGR